MLAVPLTFHESCTLASSAPFCPTHLRNEEEGRKSECICPSAYCHGAHMSAEEVVILFCERRWFIFQWQIQWSIMTSQTHGCKKSTQCVCAAEIFTSGNPDLKWVQKFSMQWLPLLPPPLRLCLDATCLSVWQTDYAKLPGLIFMKGWSMIWRLPNPSLEHNNQIVSSDV